MSTKAIINPGKILYFRENPVVCWLGYRIGLCVKMRHFQKMMHNIAYKRIRRLTDRAFCCTNGLLLSKCNANRMERLRPLSGVALLDSRETSLNYRFSKE